MAQLLTKQQFTFVILAHFACIIVYVQRVNLNITIVAMVKRENVTEIDGTNIVNEEGIGQKFTWNKVQQGYVLSAFYYGYIISQIPGGYLAERFSGKYVLGGCLLLSSLASLLTPIIAKSSLSALISLRALIGIVQGPVAPTLYSLIANWVSIENRSKTTTIIITGFSVGTVIASPVSGLLASSTILGGWPSVFYFAGTIGLLSFILWMALVHRDPRSLQLDGFENIRTKSVTTCAYPWLSLLTSRASLVTFFTHFCVNWIFVFLLTGLPTFYRDVLDVDLALNGFYSALPFFAATVFANLAGYLADRARKSGRFSMTQIRKMVCIASMLPTPAFLLLAGCAKSNQVYLAVFAMTLATGFIECCTAGPLVAAIDIAPNYSGIMFGIANMFGCTAGLVEPIVMGYFIKGHGSKKQYSKVLGLSSAIAIVGCVVFVTLGTAEPQVWASKENEDYKTSNSEERIMLMKDKGITKYTTN